ncbi:MAG: glutamate 5-kinase [Gammaproteobacteria bacterium]|nr:glutamate 5-kinase [Gammaproteobacteria bacterium]NIN62260.1 glutamate 5-kinase [Gammaproteobacteria bacterium]NIO62271.1 glutamate 5-kinase [Gammaproteobacteria bacterium]NIP48790.1 glutamate 5-kinase [Gammaproteobacteria bacterium]NIQ09244.1 glutamate 5-kinase [Gammaproteobacteria bacterium]
MNNERKKLGQARRWVVKLGSSLLTNNGCGLRVDSLQAWVNQMMDLRKQGCDVVVVSSGATAEGVARLGWKKRPHAIHELQAAAAVGQMGLVQAYETCFQQYAVHTAQILLTHADIADRQRYLNARSSLSTLIKLGVVPIINENDTVSTDEIKFGDNDTLAGLVANLIEADLLVLLTDQQGLYDQDPRVNPSATLITEADAGDLTLLRYAGKGGVLGRGGMQTKLHAATLAAKSGASSVIASGHETNILTRLAAGEDLGTLLKCSRTPLTARKQWLASQSRVQGKLILDAGAVTVLVEKGKSLLSVGVQAVEGDFRRGEIVSCLDEDRREIARGLVNYGASEARKIMGRPSDKFESLLGYVDEPELIHRDNLILI